MNKRGQFYLIIAVVLAAIILGISTVSNYSKKEQNLGIEELKQEIKIESEKTLDYGINNRLSSPQINSLLQNLTTHYIIYEGRDDKNLYFIFGTTSSLTVSGFQNTASIVTISSGGNQTVITQTAGSFTGNHNPSSNNISLYINGNPYNFTLSSQENFYFVLKEYYNGGEYIVTA